jgi:hypothetical protein
MDREVEYRILTVDIASNDRRLRPVSPGSINKICVQIEREIEIIGIAPRGKWGTSSEIGHSNIERLDNSG